MILDNILEAFFMGAALAGIYTIWHQVTETCESVTCEKCREDFFSQRIFRMMSMMRMNWLKESFCVSLAEMILLVFIY